ncbi:MAG: hypothetical protein WC317_07430 [Candidatus Omnitrophota bacterium]
MKNIKVGVGIGESTRAISLEDEKKSDLLEKLYYTDEPVDQVIDKFMKQYYNHREHDFLIKICVEEVKERSSYQNSVICARLLGKFKAKEGIQALVDNILIGPFDIGINPALEKVESIKINKDDFPAAYALMQIGKSSTNALREKIASLNGEEEEDDVYRLICLNTIKKIEGDKKAKILINNMIEKEKNLQRKQNLEKALKLF